MTTYSFALKTIFSLQKQQSIVAEADLPLPTELVNELIEDGYLVDGGLSNEKTGRVFIIAQ
jgi:hypothetical protein